MRLADIDILIIPGWMNSGPDHWQSRWERNMRSARRVEQADWNTPVCADWEERIIAETARSHRPTMLVAHDCGVNAVVRAAPRLAGARVVGAFLVAPTDVAGRDLWIAKGGGFAELPEDPLPFPSKLIGSSTDPDCTVERTQELGLAWGSDVSIIANAGHIDTASGHGPWPEGLLSFGIFLKRLG